MEALLGAYGALDDDEVKDTPGTTPSPSQLPPPPLKRSRDERGAIESPESQAASGVGNGSDVEERPSKVPRLEATSWSTSTASLRPSVVRSGEESSNNDEDADGLELDDFFAVNPSAGQSQRHDGRVRQFPHLEGNYPSHIAIPIIVGADLRAAIAEAVARHGRSLPALEMVGEDELHVSLSRPFPLRRHERALFLDSTRAHLDRSVSPGLLGALWVDRMEYFWNDDRSRVFLALSLRRDHDAAMRSLLGAVDAALVAFGHAPFYADPRPHVSIAWFLPSSTVSSVVPSEATALSRAAELPWRRATVKIGQHVHALNAVTRLDA